MLWEYEREKKQTKQTNTRWNELCLINTWPGDYKRWASHLLLTLSICFPFFLSFFLLLIIISNHTICLISKNICSTSAKTMVTVMTFVLFVCMFIYLFASNRINEPERPMKINWQDKWRKRIPVQRTDKISIYFDMTMEPKYPIKFASLCHAHVICWSLSYSDTVESFNRFGCVLLLVVFFSLFLVGLSFASIIIYCNCVSISQVWCWFSSSPFLYPYQQCI